MPSWLCQYMAREFVANAAGERGVFRTSATTGAISGESQAGGGGARNSLAELNRKGVQLGVVTLAGFVPTQPHLLVGTVPVHTASEPSDFARSITRAATFRPSSRPAV